MLRARSQAWLRYWRSLAWWQGPRCYSPSTPLGRFYKPFVTGPNRIPIVQKRVPKLLSEDEFNRYVRKMNDRGIKVRPTDKMIAGFLLTAACMGVMALAAGMAGKADLRPADIKGNVKLVVADSGHSNFRVWNGGVGRPLILQSSCPGRSPRKLQLRPRDEC